MSRRLLRPDNKFPLGRRPFGRHPSQWGSALRETLIRSVDAHTHNHLLKGSSVSQTHHFGSGSFKSELWISGKRVFAKLKRVDVEFVTGGPWEWIIANAAGQVIRTVRYDKTTAGWTSIDLPSLGLHGDYSIGFRNASPSEKTIKQGDVTYG